MVCPAASDSGGCPFVGGNGIQQAVDKAADGDSILLRAGRYQPGGHRDVGFDDLTIRGHVLVQDKSLMIIGEPGTVFDGSGGEPASALVVHRGTLTLRGVTIQATRAASPEDDIYDGHGVFVVHGTATLEDVTFRAIEKMALSIRGHSAVTVRDVRIRDGHVGIWIEENATLRIEGCAIVNNDSAGVAAYANARVEVEGCVFDRNLDDGLYAAENATIVADASLFTGNAPYALRSVDRGSITVTGSTFYGNAATRDADDGREGAVRSSRFFDPYCAQDERQSELPESGCSQ